MAHTKYLIIFFPFFFVCGAGQTSGKSFDETSKNQSTSMYIDVQNQKVKLYLTPPSLPGLLQNIEFNAENINSFSVSKKMPMRDGFRVFGLYIPYLLKIGKFYSFINKDWEYWDVNLSKEGFFCVFHLKDGPYKRVVIKTNNFSIIEIMKTLKNAKYWDFGEAQTQANEIRIGSSNHEFTARIVRPKKGKTIKGGILLIQGSGPTDKEWNSPSLRGKNGSGKIIAELLAREGYCTLAFDKIGTPGNTFQGEISWQDYLFDQREALNVLINEIPTPDSLYILGHSEGSIHAIRLFEEEKNNIDVSGLILLAPTGRTLKEIILSQVSKQVDNIPFLSREKKDQSLLRLSKGLDSIAEGSPIPTQSLGLPFYLKKFYELFAKAKTLKYSQEIFNFDPKQHILNVDVPVLLVAAKKDLQSVYEEDALALYEYAANHHLSNIELEVIKNSNHVFKYEPKSLEKLGVFDAFAYNKESRAVDIEAIISIVCWLEKINSI